MALCIEYFIEYPIEDPIEVTKNSAAYSVLYSIEYLFSFTSSPTDIHNTCAELAGKRSGTTKIKICCACALLPLFSRGAFGQPH